MKQVVQEYAQDFALIAVADALLATEEDYEIVAKALWESRQGAGEVTQCFFAQG